MAIPIIARNEAGKLVHFYLTDPGVKKWNRADSTLYFVPGKPDRWAQYLHETHPDRYEARAKAPRGAGFVNVNYATFISREQARDWFIATAPVAPPPMDELISCRLAGDKIGVSHDTAARLLKMLVIEGTIELVTPGGTKGSKRAAEYRFIG